MLCISLATTKDTKKAGREIGENDRKQREYIKAVFRPAFYMKFIEKWELY